MDISSETSQAIIRDTMKTEEHLLIVGVLAHYLQVTHALFEVLYSRGLAEADDLTAFAALVNAQKTKPRDAMFQRSLDLYLEVARRAGVVTGLESEGTASPSK